jgi:hypothetical protein
MKVHFRGCFGANPMVVPSDATEYTHPAEVIALCRALGADWYWSPFSGIVPSTGRSG